MVTEICIHENGTVDPLPSHHWGHGLGKWDVGVMPGVNIREGGQGSLPVSEWAAAGAGKVACESQTTGKHAPPSVGYCVAARGPGPSTPGSLPGALTAN